jgi:ROS/MUCR transcriptional regulator protein
MQYTMTPEQYREKWGPPVDYSMVAPNYAKARSELAMEVALGQQEERQDSWGGECRWAKRLRQGRQSAKVTVPASQRGRNAR